MNYKETLENAKTGIADLRDYAVDEIKAVSFVAMDPAPADYYHTRRDTADILVPETIEKTIEIALQTVFDFDEKGV